MSSDGAVSFGRYRLIEQLGRGGMASVHRAVIDGPKGFVHELAIKRIRPEYCQNQRFVNMLATEARLCGRLRHPGIVQVHEFGEVEGEYYLAMELVEGPDLLRVLRACAQAGRKLPTGLACHIVNELAGALGYAHALNDDEGRPLGIVHRDLSPSNVMISSLGIVKLLDFGIAKAASHVREEQTVLGGLKGKISYMSPQQADGLLIDQRSDIFSLGVVFYECLTQRRLFHAATDIERLRRVRNANVVPPSQLCRGLDPAIEAIVLKMLARDPEARYASCDEIVAALTPIAHRLHGHAGALRSFVSELAPFLEAKSGATLPPLSAKKLAGVAGSLDVDEEALPPSSPSASGTMAESNGELLSVQQPVARASPTMPRRWWAYLVGAGLLLLGLWASSRWVGGGPAAKPVGVPASAAKPTTGSAETATTLPAPRSLPAPLGAPTVAPPTLRLSTPLSALAPAPSVAGTPRPVAPVRLRIAGTAGAEVLVDGRLVGELPLDVALSPVAGERRVLVQRTGYTTWTRKVAGDTNVSLTAKLSRKRRSGKTDRSLDPGNPEVYDPFAH